MAAPILITIYGKNNEAEKDYSIKVVSWGILKRAIRLQEELREDDDKPVKNDWISPLPYPNSSVFYKNVNVKKPTL